ncbi:MAG: CD225/dispanin family protein [Bergeyella zoohelcum]|nr:CD225/dispanin family protein [Bergeyella zoohelcum]
MEKNNFQSPPDNNLVWAILTTVLCCLPTGIYAIVKAAEVNTKWAMGDHEGAIKSANEAKKWSIIGAIIGGSGFILYMLFIFLAVVIEAF